MLRQSLLSAVMALTVLANIRADDWPQWRGPDRNGVSKEKGLLTAWPKEGPKLLWTFKTAGLGFSSMAVVGDSVYMTGSVNEKEDAVIALDAGKGTLFWTVKIGPLFTFANNTWGDGPRSTPTIDGNLLYALGGDGDLICVDRTAKGKELWRTNLKKDLGGEMMTQWGYSASPLVDGDLLICTPGGSMGTLAALDKKTGKVQWRSTKLTHAATYGSVVAAEIQGTRQYVFNSYTEDEGGFLNGVSAKDGKLLWSVPTFKGTKYAVSGTPLVVDNEVYINIGESGGLCHLFAIDKKMKAKDRYSKEVQKSVRNNYGGVVLVGEHIYGHKEPGSWFCQDFKTGALAWEDNTKLECRTGSIIAAGNMLYLYSDSGETVLLKADPKGWSEAGRFKIPETSAFPKKRPSSRASKVWSHPAIANGRLYLRDCELVFCYDIREK